MAPTTRVFVLGRHQSTERENKMRFGRISAALLIIAGATLVATILCKPG
ncbi:MAG: hypothetical protein H8E73_07395 [Planctomycetes bacterium]|nr:hypothetical protein [Planctomycetota bacterium]MBL7185920.1 hypothetical protein [Phycisphaerae bacterium]